MVRLSSVLRVALVPLALVSVEAGKPSAPAAALSRLQAGNARFASGAAEGRPGEPSQRASLGQGQSPFAAVLSCADARVPPEAIFDAGPGDLFVVRVAGGVADRAVLASVEQAVETLRTPLVVALGHEFCETVRAAAAPPHGSQGPNLDFLLSAIRPAVARSETRPGTDRLRAAILSNVEEVMNALVSKSDIIRAGVAGGRVDVVGGYYELSTGRVHFSSVVGARDLSAAR